MIGKREDISDEKTESKMFTYMLVTQYEKGNTIAQTPYAAGLEIVDIKQELSKPMMTWSCRRRAN